MKKWLKSFFYSNGKPQPIYFWATLFLALTFYMGVCRVVYPLDKLLDLSDTLILGMMAGVIALTGLYHYFDKKYPSKWDGEKRREEDEKLR